jgi:hypothetical protein
LFEKGRVTAIIDLELAHLGDPVADLAGLFSRDLSEPLGDLQRAIKRYETLTDSVVDRALLDFHTARWCLCTPLAVAGLVAAPPPGLDFAQYLSWYWAYSRAAIEVIARSIGVALEDIALPDPVTSRHSPAYGVLLRDLESTAGGDGFGAYEAQSTLRVAQYLENVDRFGEQIEDAEQGDARALLGARPASGAAADEQLEAAVLEDAGGREAEWVRYLHRRCLRQEALLGPAMRELDGVRIQSADLPS